MGKTSTATAGTSEVAQPPAAVAWDPLHLLDGVREVAELVDPVDISAVTQRAFDDARGRCPGFEALPAARNISERIGLSWSKVLEVAELPRERRTISLGRLLGEHEEHDWLTPAGVEFALRLVARRLDAPTLTPSAYDAERDRLLRENRRRWYHGGLLLPNSNQILSVVSCWDAALANAGLAAREGLGGAPRRAAGWPIVDVLACCYEHHEVLPSWRRLEVFAAANDIPMRKKETGKAWTTYVAEWKAARRARGLPEPNGPAPRGEEPDFSRVVGTDLAGGRQQTRTLDDCIDWVVRYLTSLGPRQTPSQNGYRKWARTQDNAPWPAVFDRRHGGWVRVRDAAWERLRARA